MSKSQMLRALVTERLTAAAEDIFVLFERTMAEYEEEVCRRQEEVQRRRRSPAGLQPRAGARLQALPGVKQEVKQEVEQEQLPVFVLESSAVCVEREESSLLQHQEDISSEPHFHSSDADIDCWGPFRCSPSQMDTEADGDHYDQISAAPNTGLPSKHRSEPETKDKGADQGPERRHVCPFCLRRFTSNANLQVHIRNHTGERPYSCSVCEKTFAHKNIFINHRRMHTGEKPFSCSHCGKTFAHNSTLNTHLRVHTGEKPFSCTLCEKTFAQRSTLDKHLRIHRGEKPHSCSFCQKHFAQKSDLNAHTRTHTGEKPFRCSLCNKEFAVKSNLYRHMGTHPGERLVAKTGSSV